jgi:Zn-dependent protease with chaperone function
VSSAALYAITGTMTPSKVSAAYRLGLFVTALAMLVLPLLYFGLIVAVGYGVWWHLSSNAWLLSGVDNALWRAVGYFGPAVAGLILVFFMVKPILARPAKRIEPIPLSPDEESVLFQFVHDVCRQVGAVPPDRIQVDCNVNASASFASPPLGPQRPPLVLTIGLPLAGLTVRQFGGVLAHEFGHFAQNSGMRLTFIVRSINRWFARVVRERDEWDERLEKWSKEGGHVAVSVTMALARLAVWGSRLVLSLLMAIGHAISCFMLRQMEYDADSYETKLVGSRTFASTCDRLQELTVGVQIGSRELRTAWAERVLPANLPAFLLECAARVPPELLKSTRDRTADEKTGVFDTHPCNRDRLRAAEQADAAGVLEGGEGAASRLFADFEGLGAIVTHQYYEHDLKLPISGVTLLDTASALATIQRRDENQRAASAFFHDGLSLLRPIRVAMLATDAVDDPSVDWAQARATMDTMRTKISEQYRRYESLQRTRDLATAALAFIESGYSRLVPQQFELTEATAADATATLARANAQLTELEPALARFESAAATRLGCMLAITQSARAGRDPASPSALSTGHELKAEVRFLVEQLAVLATAWPDLIEMHHVAVVLLIVAPPTAAYNENPQARTVTLGRFESRLGKHWRSARTTIAHVPAGGSPTQSLADAVGMDSESCADPRRAAAVVERAATLRSDLIVRLAAIAVQLEEIADASQNVTCGDPS